MLFWMQWFWKKLHGERLANLAHLISCHFPLHLQPATPKFRNVKLPHFSKNTVLFQVSVSLHMLYSLCLSSPRQISVYLLKCNLDLLYSKKPTTRCPQKDQNSILHVLYVTFGTVRCLLFYEYTSASSITLWRLWFPSTQQKTQHRGGAQ